MNALTLVDQAAREQVLDVGQSLQVIAPAGSGKTGLLIQRTLKCLAQVEKPEEVLFITFTNKAANEALTRLTEALTAAAGGAKANNPHEELTLSLARDVLARDQEKGWNLIKNPGRIRVLTFDALNSQLAAQLPILSGFGGRVRIETQALPMYEQAIENLFQEYETDDIAEEVREALSALLRFADNRVEDIKSLLTPLLASRDQWLGQLHDHQSFDMESTLATLVNDRLQMAQHLLPGIIRTELVAILGASSDAQHTQFSHSSQWPDAEPDHLDSWRDLANVLLTGSGTFRKRITKKEGFPAKEEITERMKVLLLEVNGLADSGSIAAMLHEVRRLPGITYPEQLDAFREALSLVLYRLAAHLQVVFKGAGSVDFIEVALRAHAALGDDDNVNEALLKLDYSLRHILVDETQDTSVTQYRLLGRITSGWEADDGRSICFCGDPQQSIYSFRQAEVALFLKLRQEKAFYAIPLQCLVLSTNFRSRAGVVDWFNNTFQNIFPATEDPYTSAVTFSPSAAFLADPGEQAIHVHGFVDKGTGDEEAAAIVEIIAASRQQNPAGSIAILIRSRSHVSQIIPALREAEIDYSCQDIDPLSSKSAVSDVVCIIRALWHPMDRSAWMGLLRAPFVGLAWADCVALVKGQLATPILDRCQHALQQGLLSTEGLERLQGFMSLHKQVTKDHASLRQQAQTLWYALGGPACVTQAEANDIDRLFELLEQHCVAGHLQNIEAFCEGLNALYASPETGAVQIMTIHKAKGLEFDTLILPGLGRASRQQDRSLLYHRQLPGGYMITPNPGKYTDKNSPASRLYEYMHKLNGVSKQHETLRLLYVAITRTRKTLHLLGNVNSGKDGKAGDPRSGSFLSCLWPVVADQFKDLPAGQSSAIPVQSAERLRQALAPRLPSDWQWPTLPRQYTPQTDIAALPSETAATGADDHDENIVQRIIGKLYHALIQRISDEGVAGWNKALIHQQQAALGAGCRRLGMPEPEVSEAVNCIMRLIIDTLACDTGIWLLQNRTVCENELQLTGYLNKKWQTGIIDRFFVEDGTAWIVDYKSGGSNLKAAQKTAFIKAEIKRYRQQLVRYRDLISARYGYNNIQIALYFPAFGKLVLVEPAAAG